MEEIERRAEAVLAALPSWLWDGESLPVPVEAIADTHYGLLVREVEEMSRAPGCPDLGPGQSLSGLLLTDRGEIWVSATEAREWPGRRRFTIGHELGHWVMHRDAHRSVFCRSGAVAEGERGAGAESPEPPASSKGSSEGADIEDEASAFAAALLMPAHIVRREYERDRTFERLCRRFGASATAMGRRLHAVVPRGD